MPNSKHVQDLLLMLTGRQRSKLRGRIKRHFGLNRRMVGAIGAGHIEAPPGYEHVLLGVLELIRARRSAFAAATPSRRPVTMGKREGGVYGKRAEARATSHPRGRRR